MDNGKHGVASGYIDLGHKDTMQEIPMVAEGKANPTIRYPSLYIEKDAQLKGKNVGDMMTASVKLRLRGVEERDQNGKKTVRCDYEVMAIKFDGSHYKKD